jgi:hypothetical protein
MSDTEELEGDSETPSPSPLSQRKDAHDNGTMEFQHTAGLSDLVEVCHGGSLLAEVSCQCIAIWVRDSDSDSESPGELEGTSTKPDSELATQVTGPGPELRDIPKPGQVRFKLQSQLAGFAFRVLFKIKLAQFPPPSRAMPPHRRHWHCRATAVAACRRSTRTPQWRRRL